MYVLDFSSMVCEHSGWLQLSMRHGTLACSPSRTSTWDTRASSSFPAVPIHLLITVALLRLFSHKFSTSDRSKAPIPRNKPPCRIFLTSHINNFRFPPSSSDQLTRRAALPSFHSVPLMIAKAEPPKLYTPPTPPFSSQTPQLLASALHETSRAGKPA